MFSAILRLRLVSQVSLLAAIAAVLYFYLTSTHSTPVPTIPFLVHQSPDMAALQYLKPIIVNPRAKHTATIIFLHGLGDTGYGWKPVADMFSTDSALHHVKWILPHAPTVPVTANRRVEMPAWYDILGFEWPRAQEDEAGMLRSVAYINKLVDSEVDEGISPDRILIGGFSQGGALSLLTGLTSERKFGGVAVLSGYLPLPDRMKTMATFVNKLTPWFWGHGEDDPLVEFSSGVRSADFLKKELGIPPADAAAPEKGGLLFNSYEDVPHSTSNEELRDLKEWLKKVLPATA